MLNIPLLAKINHCIECDLEIAATLIDVVCWREVNTPSLINSDHNSLTINIFINGAPIEITDLILLYENEDIDFIALPPSSLPDSELADLFGGYNHIREFDFDLDESSPGYIRLNKNLIQEGICPVSSYYFNDEINPNVSIINLGKSFHFFTHNYLFGSLTNLSYET